MADIDEDRALSFRSVMDNGGFDAAIEESIKRVRGLSDATISGGKAMDGAMSGAAGAIRARIGDLGAAIELHTNSLNELKNKYDTLGVAAGEAFMAGRDKEYQAIQQQKLEISGEITLRGQLIAKMREMSNALEEQAEKEEQATAKTVSYRTQLREAREELIRMEQAGQRGTEAFRQLQERTGQLQNAMTHASMQAKTLANDEAKFQGIVSGLSGLAGGFAAATGAIGLFSDKNEDLQKVMTKVQQVMALTMGMSQVAAVLGKDSAFRLVTITGLQEWWTGVKIKANAVQTTAIATETAETVAISSNVAALRAQGATLAGSTGLKIVDTAATGAQAAAAEAGTVANVGLAGAFRLVGTAIKSIPVFGWIIAGVGALIAAVSYFTKASREAKAQQEEFAKSVTENVYKPIGAIGELSAQWTNLGDNLEAKKQFVLDNQKAFDELGISVRDVADAEKLLIKNKQAFIDAQIAKATAMAYAQQAAEKIKKQLELQRKLERTPEKIVTGDGFSGGRTFSEKDNPEYKSIADELKKVKGEISKGYENAAAETQKGADILKKTFSAANGSVAAEIEQKQKQIALMNAAIGKLDAGDVKSREAAYNQIKKWQEQINSLEGKDAPKAKKAAHAKKQEDPFIKQLETDKKAYGDYQKWINAGLDKEAQTEFAYLLKRGKNYEEYLQKLKDSDKINQTQRRRIMTELADENSKSLLEAFKSSLSEQLGQADSIIAKMELIARKRKELKNDGTDLDKGKKETLDEADKQAVKEINEDWKKSLEEYEKYKDSQLSADERYFKQRKALQALYDNAGTPEIKKAVKTQIDTLDKRKQTTDNTDYDELLKKYKSYQQQRESIAKEYDEKIAVATKNSNFELVANLQKAKKEDTNKVDTEEFINLDEYKELFSNLDNLTVSKIIELRDKLEAQWAQLDLPPDQLKAIRDQLDKATEKLEQKSPFSALLDGWRKYKAATDAGSKKMAMNEMLKSGAAVAGQVNSAISAVTDGMEQMGIEMDDSTKAVVKDVQGILGGAGELAQGIASGNVVGMISGAAKIIANSFDLIFGGKDRKAQKEIEKHAEKVKQLQSVYEDLERAISKSLGTEVYANQTAAIENMKAQQRELQAMREAEAGKKKSDKGKIDSYDEQIKSLGNKIADTVDDIAKSALQTDGKSFADQLGDALVDAFGKGEDAAKAFGDVTNSIMKNAILNQLKKQFLEKQLQGALDKLYADMGGDGANFSWDGLTEAERTAFKDRVAGIANNFNEQMKVYSEVFQDAPGVDKSLSGAVKGVSEETASLLAGQINAIRINQIEATDLVRQSLMNLATIAQNTSYNKYLQSIDAKLDKMSTGDTLRSQGLS